MNLTPCLCGIGHHHLQYEHEAVMIRRADITIVDDAARSEVGGAHAPEPTAAGWSQAAAASINAGLTSLTQDISAARRGNDATAALTPPPDVTEAPSGDRWADFDTQVGVRERRAVLLAQNTEDCARRVTAWASTLPTPQQQATALEAADVIRGNR